MNVSEERRVEVGLPVPWKQNGMLVSLVFFFLTCVALGAMYGFWDMLKVEAGLFTGVVGLATAEYLIRRHRFFGTGIESALWIGSLFALITALPGEGKKEAIFLFALAALIAALRLRQPWFGALSVVLAISYFGLVRAPRTVLILSIAVTLIALAGLAKTWRRPSVERFLSILVIAVPVLPLLWNAYNFWGAVPVPAAVFVAIYVALAITLVAAGLVLKHHAPLVAALVAGAVAMVRYQAVRVIDLEWQLLLLGTVLLAAAALVYRLLKERTRGLVVTPASLTILDEELQIAATVTLHPPASISAPPETRAGGGGEFGGAGATGDY